MHGLVFAEEKAMMRERQRMTTPTPPHSGRTVLGPRPKSTPPSINQCNTCLQPIITDSTPIPSRSTYMQVIQGAEKVLAKFSGKAVTSAGRCMVVEWVGFRLKFLETSHPLTHETT